MTIAVIQMLNPFGVEVAWDANLVPAEADAEELRGLFHKRKLILLRNQSLCRDAMDRFAGTFGQLLNKSAAGSAFMSSNPDLVVLGDVELAYHSDLAFAQKPYRAIALHAIDVADEETSACFVDSVEAYRILPTPMRERIHGSHALHVLGVMPDGPNGEELAAEGAPHHIHPLVIEHPVTGEPLLYISRNQTARIVEIGRDESAALIDTLLDHCYRTGSELTHAWRNGDLIIWDNIALQHARGRIPTGQNRTLQRAVIADAGLIDQFPTVREWIAQNGLRQ